MKGCLILLGALVVIVVVAAAALLLLVTIQSHEVSEQPPVPISTEAAESFDKKIGAVETAIATSEKSTKPVPVTLTITEQELNSKVAEALRENPDTSGLNPRNVQVRLLPGEIVTTAAVPLGGFDTSITITSLVTISGGKPQLTVQSVRAGGLPLPGFIQDQITRASNRNWSRAGLTRRSTSRIFASTKE